MIWLNEHIIASVTSLQRSWENQSELSYEMRWGLSRCSWKWSELWNEGDQVDCSCNRCAYVWKSKLQFHIYVNCIELEFVCRLLPQLTFIKAKLKWRLGIPLPAIGRMFFFESLEWSCCILIYQNKKKNSTLNEPKFACWGYSRFVCLILAVYYMSEIIFLKIN